MPDKRHHRGPHPDDATLFAPVAWMSLRTAVAELSWLLTRGYATPSALKIVGDRHNLTDRQRTAVMRCACSDQSRDARVSRRLEPASVAGQTILIDGYNVLTSIEAALGNCVILIARDSCWRDMASIHGTCRKVDETLPALQIAGDEIGKIGVDGCVWYLDAPVSNSGRLASIMREMASPHGWNWDVQIVPSPDAILSNPTGIVATADSVILDRCGRWINLAQWIIEGRNLSSNLIDLSNSYILKK